MSNKKQNEELQSRREFFKKAAKAALPVVGAVVMASVPTLLQASSSSCGYCQYSCTSCVGGCLDNCSRSCTTCSNGCARGCHANCYTGCNGRNNNFA